MLAKGAPDVICLQFVWPKINIMLPFIVCLFKSVNHNNH